MRVHDTAFTANRMDNNILVIQKLTGKLSHKVSLDNVSWCNNRHNSPRSLALLSAQHFTEPCREKVGELYLSLNSILAHSNIFFTDDTHIQTSMYLMHFSHIKHVSMTGNNYLAGNTGCTVINLVASELAVSGNLTIMDGHAYQGGGISMDVSSTLAFEEPLVAGFYNNIADQGSAIYSPVEHNNQDVESKIQVRPYEKYSLNNVTSINISLHFSNNTDGIIYRSFYAPHFSCFGHQTSPNFSFSKYSWDANRSQYAYTTLIDTILHMNKIDKYTSLSNGFCIQPRHQEWECKYLDQMIKNYKGQCETPSYGSAVIYPGQIAFNVHYLDPNQLLSTGFCHGILEYLFKPYRYSSVKRNNSTLSYKFAYPPYKAGYFTVMLRDLDIYDTLPWYTDYSYLGLPVFQFNASDCPIGFSLKNESCTCNNKLDSHGYICDIDTETITSPPGYWTGLEDGDLLFDDHCHPQYCNVHGFNLTDNDDPAEACLGNRTGILCGECKVNYSVVFGSDTCYDHCTDVYLVTIPAYALAGLLLVFLLFMFRITVATGTVNGVIFFGNVLGLVLDQLTEDKFHRVHYINYEAFVRVFISLLNLDLGFPLCFYEGMTTAYKVGFQFLFPVYLWSIVVMLILLSKWSIRLSELVSKSSVQVLVTLFYLSFSKLLSAVIVIFSSSTISVIQGTGNYTSRLVWYYDGHDYGSSTHAILLALAVAFTVLFLFPYALLVTFSSHLLRFRFANKFKPFIDAYSGPFKNKWRFWFGLRLWITILLFGLDGALQGTNTNVMFVVIIITILSFMFFQNLVRPFKNRFIGALDLFFMANYCLLVSSFFWTTDIFWFIYVLTTAIAALTAALIVIGHLFVLSETCQFKCAKMLQQLQYEERNDHQYHEAIQGDDEDVDLFAAAEERVQDTY